MPAFIMGSGLITYFSKPFIKESSVFPIAIAGTIVISATLGPLFSVQYPDMVVLLLAFTISFLQAVFNMVILIHARDEWVGDQTVAISILILHETLGMVVGRVGQIAVGFNQLSNGPLGRFY